MTSAVLDDIASLIMVAIVVPVATGDASLTLPGMLFTAGKALLFFVFVSIVGAWVFPHQLTGWISHVPVIGRYGIRSLLAFDNGHYATLAILLVALVVGLVAVYFGFHPAVGAYMAGLIIKEEYFGTSDDDHLNTIARKSAHFETKKIIDNAAFSWVGPVFFVDLGAKLVFDVDILLQVLPYAAVLTIGLFVFQILSASLAARYTGGMGWHASLMICFGMLGRAELAFVVMDIAYVQHSILNEQAFFTLMITAFFLNIAVPVTIGWWRPYYLAAEAKV